MYCSRRQGEVLVYVRTSIDYDQPVRGVCSKHSLSGVSPANESDSNHTLKPSPFHSVAFGR